MSDTALLAQPCNTVSLEGILHVALTRLAVEDKWICESWHIYPMSVLFYKLTAVIVFALSLCVNTSITL